jgi:hypothetical protein
LFYGVFMIGGRGPQRRSPALAIAVLLALAIGGTLSGCVPDAAPHPTAAPTTSAPNPVFASDDEALAAATDAYKAYLAMSDLIASEGGQRPERMADVAVDSALSDAVEGLTQFTTMNLHSSGATAFDHLSLQKRSSDDVDVYLCEDVSGIDVLDGQGVSVVSPNRKPRTPFQVTLTRTSNASLLVKNRVAWAGQYFC